MQYSEPTNKPAGINVVNAAKTQQANAYLRTKVMSASPEELRLMLLEGAIKFAQQGREGLLHKNYEQSFTGLSSCRDIVFELMTTIRAEINPELAANIKGLYTFIYTQLIEGSHEKDVAKVDKAIELLEYERETWVLLVRRFVEKRAGAIAPLPTHAEAARSISVQG
jgi:flagellar secretion chaperone FliS